MGSFTLFNHKFLLRNWDKEILDSFHVLMLKLSNTRDMVLRFFHLQRLCTFPTRLDFHQDRTFQKPSLRPNGRIPTYHPTTTNCPNGQVIATYMIQAEPIMPCGCTRSFLTFVISNPFVPGWLSTSEIHKVNHRNGPCVTTQHKPFFPFHPGVSFT